MPRGDRLEPLEVDGAMSPTPPIAVATVQGTPVDAAPPRAVEGESFSVRVPRGFKRGDSLQIEAGGHYYDTRVPDGLVPGDVFPVTPGGATTPLVVATPVSTDEEYALELQRAELGGYDGADPGLEAHNELERARAAALGAAAGEIAAAGLAGLQDAEQLVINYRYSIKCFAVVDALIVLLTSLTGGWALWGLLLLIGPCLGYTGAQSLDKNQVRVYVLFCALGVVYEFVLFVLSLSFYVFLFLVVKFWILQIVFKFHRVLASIPKDRARALAAPAYAVRARAVYY